MWIASDKKHLIASGDKEGQCDQEYSTGGRAFELGFGGMNRSLPSRDCGKRNTLHAGRMS